MFEPPIQLHENRLHDRVSGPEVMREITRRVVEEALAKSSLSPEAALDEAGLLRVRYRETPGITISGIVNHATEGSYVHIVGTTLAEAHREVRLNQENGDWQLVAWEGFEQRTTRAASEPNPLSAVPYEKMTAPQNPTKTLPIEILDPRLSLRLTYVDAIRGPWLDPWHERTGREVGVMNQLAKTQDLRNAPPFIREERKHGLALLERFVAYRKAAKIAAPRASRARKPGGLSADQRLAVTQMHEAKVPNAIIAQGMGLTEAELAERMGWEAPVGVEAGNNEAT
jgi:hypothetical protein